MKTRSLFVSLLTLIGLIVASCENTPIDNGADKCEIQIASTEIDVTVEGGECSIEYSIINGLDHIDIVVSCDEPWVYAVGTYNNRIKFTVARNNTTEVRSAEILIRYPDIEDKTIVVVQEANPYGDIFDIEVKDVTSTGCTTVITPKESAMPYIVLMAELDYLVAAGIDNAEALFIDDYYNFISMANQAGATSLRDFMLEQEIAFIGQSNIRWASMVPERDHVLYVYGIEFSDDESDYWLTTPIHYEIIHPTAAPLMDVEFDVNISVNGPEVYYEFAPKNWNGKYYIDIYSEGESMYLPEGSTPDNEYSLRVANDWINLISLYMTSGYSAEQLYELMCLEGPDSYSELRTANTKYMMSFYAIDMVDGLPQVVSKPYVVHFQTEVVEASDMTIDIDIVNLYTRIIDVNITPTNDTDSYAITLLPTDVIPTGTNAEIINWAINNIDLSLYRGPVTSHINVLEPETSYTILAFGYFGGTVTTDLFRADFTTTAAGECQNSVLGIEIKGPYSPVEYEQAFPDALYGMGEMYEQYGFCVITSEIFTEYPSTDMFHYIFEPEEFMYLGQDGVFAELLEYQAKKVAVYTPLSGVLFAACGVTMDTEGDYSEMWVGEPFSFNYNAETKRPIEELVASLEKNNEALPASVVIGRSTTHQNCTIMLQHPER